MNSLSIRILFVTAKHCITQRGYTICLTDHQISAGTYAQTFNLGNHFGFAFSYSYPIRAQAGYELSFQVAKVID